MFGGTSVGGNLLVCRGAGNVTFTAGQAFNAADIYYIQTWNAGELSISFNDGSERTQIRQHGPQCIKKITIISDSPQQAVVVEGCSEPAYILGIDCYDLRRPHLKVWNMGWAGSTTETWTRTDTPWSSLNALRYFAPDFAILDLGINDWCKDVNPEAYKQNLVKISEVLLEKGDVILKSPLPTKADFVSLSTQEKFVRKMREVADELKLPLVDIWSNWENYERMVDLGFYRDPKHATALGYSDVAEIVATAFRTF
ncbi:SGNH/GDSL hydrolase family protein [Microvirga aerilata]|uniref:SGNH/GDSL hydrolase family protein n=1 Tax=Microvirga aerilata TaxID=670292 RepID=A0A936ZAQ8_9HYPH|nr:SGNH/GDSL hydrolase family protein [Microvirga aerilata]MBL0406327.1 SGNH/GDSL hydrolase family protein [Microvirga aerilata]